MEKHREWLRRSGLLPYLQRAVRGVELKETFYGRRQGFFASPIGYPHIGVAGVGAEEPFTVEGLKALSYREALGAFAKTVVGQRRAHVANPRLHENLQLMAMAVKPFYVEMHFRRRPSAKLSLSPLAPPLGPRAPLERLIEAENAKVPKKVWEFYEERVKASTALEELSSFPVEYLQQLLSAGILGEKKRFVPTRWAITAVDDMLGKLYIERVRNLKVVEGYAIYHGQLFHNSYTVLLIPQPFGFINYEAWAPKTSWGAEEGHLILKEEEYRERKRYAETQAGGYYASRLAVVEHLLAIGRQALAVVFREVDEHYRWPLGVWQVREGVREALRRPVCRCSSWEEAKEVLKGLLRIPLERYGLRIQQRLHF